MEKTELENVLKLHKKWLNYEKKGSRINLPEVNLSDADLLDANLSDANLAGANLSDANLSRANLAGANLSRANLSRANLSRANLSEANLLCANLSGANLDYANWPLWCGSKNVRVDVKIARQLAAHFCALDCDNEEYQEAKKAILGFAQKSHRAIELGLI